MSGNKVRIFLTIIVVVLVLSVGVIGFRLTRKPFDLVEITLNKRIVDQDESLTLTIHNYGFNWVQFGSIYEIYREYDNGTLRKFEFPDNYAWTAALGEIAPLIGSNSQKVFTNLEPGNYYVRKAFTIVGIGNFHKTASFTVK